MRSKLQVWDILTPSSTSSSTPFPKPGQPPEFSLTNRLVLEICKEDVRNTEQSLHTDCKNQEGIQGCREMLQKDP